MELDTGASVSVIDTDTKNRFFPNGTLYPSKRKFSSFTKNRFGTLGYLKVRVKFKNQSQMLDLYVVDFPKDNLFGREWINAYKHQLSFSNLFDTDELNQVKFDTSDNSNTIKARLETILKGNKLRITGDYKSTLNLQLIADEHPIPKDEDIFNKVKGASLFCRLDVTDAFMSLPCTPSACELMTLNTPTHGLLVHNMVSPAFRPSGNAVYLEEILRGQDNTTNFFDDILILANIDRDIEELAKSCLTCFSHAKSPPQNNSHHWERPKEAWSRIHID
ncbi:hypothetical protein BC332_34663 [Capsicum chinense]|nr:hypothetical protein BC332_34663 [Capsicum chinense]